MEDEKCDRSNGANIEPFKYLEQITACSHCGKAENFLTLLFCTLLAGGGASGKIIFPNFPKCRRWSVANAKISWTPFSAIFTKPIPILYPSRTNFCANVHVPAYFNRSYRKTCPLELCHSSSKLAQVPKIRLAKYPLECLCTLDEERWAVSQLTSLLTDHRTRCSLAG